MKEDSRSQSLQSTCQKRHDQDCTFLAAAFRPYAGNMKFGSLDCLSHFGNNRFWYRNKRGGRCLRDVLGGCNQ
jgi:hypothetical protein